MRNLLLTLALAIGLVAPAHADFVVDSSSLPGAKTDKVPRPPTTSASQWFGATDYNAIRDSLLSLRAATLGGNLFGYTCSATRPTLPVASYFTWCKSSNLHLYVFNGTTDVDITTGGGGGTFSSIYDGTTAANNTVTEATAGQGIVLVGPASQTFPTLTLKQGATPGTGGYYWAAIDSSGVTHAWLDSGGYLNLDAINGGINAYADGAGALDYIAQLASNSTAATAGVPVQASGGYGFSSKVWDTGSASSKTSTHNLLSHPVSGNPAYGEWLINSGLTGVGTKRVLTISDGAACSGSTGLCLLNGITASPTLYAAGTLGHKSGVASSGTAIAHVIDSTNALTTAGDELVEFRSGNTKFGAIAPLLYTGVVKGIKILDEQTPAVSYLQVSGNNGSSLNYGTDAFSLHQVQARPEIIIGGTQRLSFQYNGSYTEIDGAGPIALYDNTTTGLYAGSNSVQLLIAGGSKFALDSGGNVSINAGGTATTPLIVNSSGNVSAGVATIQTYTANQHTRLIVGSANFDVTTLVDEEFLASGTVTAGEVVCLVDHKTVATCAATNNLTTIAGVAMTTATAAVVQVATRGRVATKCATSYAPTAGTLVGTSNAATGQIQSGTAPGAGAILGRVLTGENLNSSGVGKCWVYVTL